MAQYYTHGNGRGLDDLYILPESVDEHNNLKRYLDRKGIRYTMENADVEGSEWFGKVFFELPFMSGHRDSIDAEVFQNC